ncbi:MAG: hypothetical protein OSA23_02200 [Rhodospirillales bacterium]|nr:hypothetical protein [Rhodospirillales bacterium]
MQVKAQLYCHTRVDNLKARELFLRGINIQTDYSVSCSGLAQSFNQDILFGGTKDRTARATKAMEAAQSVITHDRTSSWAHHQLSTAYQWLDRLDHALNEIKVAVELNPNDLYTLHALGYKSDLAGGSNSIRYMEQAQNSIQKTPKSLTHLVCLASTYIAVGGFQPQVIMRAKPSGANSIT